MVKAGEDKVVSDARCDQMQFPRGTKSQLIIYYDGEREVALAHRYLFPDGSIGGSGKPDPKRILCCGALLFISS